MAISKDDMLSIKDFSRLTGIKQSTLRYYDDLGLFSPIIRGSNGYRYYSPQQITTINSINLLHELDMPIRKVSDIQNHRTPELMFKVLSEKEEVLEAELTKLERSYNVVRTLKRMIQIGLASDEAIVETRFFDELPIVIGSENDFAGSGFFFDAFLRFCEEAKQYRIDLRLPVGGMFADFDAFCATPSFPTHFFSVDPKGLDKRPAGKYVSAFSRGYYGETGNLVERMRQYIQQQNLRITGPVFHIFLHDELSIDNPHNYLLHATVEVA
ncbi:MAG: MerR family transcriptional regulator [Clostridiales bacterium]|nr:MerR family transcriptional regulator [Clostridiales bacterium]